MKTWNLVKTRFFLPKLGNLIKSRFFSKTRKFGKNSFLFAKNGNILSKFFSAQSVLSLLCRDSTWVIIRQQDTVSGSVSKLHSSFNHSFYKTKSSSRDIWHVTWNSIDQTKCNFTSFHAVEARSLDRGFRIVKNEMKNDIVLHNSNNR